MTKPAEQQIEVEFKNKDIDFGNVGCSCDIQIEMFTSQLEVCF